MILGIDILQRLGVRIDARTRTAKPTVLVSSIKPGELWRVPACTAVVFSIGNPYEGQKKKILFESSDKLKQVIRGTTSLGSGQWLYIGLVNVGEEDQVLDPTWEISTAEVVEEEPDFLAGRTEKRDSLKSLRSCLKGRGGVYRSCWTNSRMCLWGETFSWGAWV